MLSCRRYLLLYGSYSLCQKVPILRPSTVLVKTFWCTFMFISSLLELFQSILSLQTMSSLGLIGRLDHILNHNRPITNISQGLSRLLIWSLGIEMSYSYPCYHPALTQSHQIDTDDDYLTVLVYSHPPLLSCDQQCNRANSKLDEQCSGALERKNGQKSGRVILSGKKL